MIKDLLNQEVLNESDILQLLKTEGNDRSLLFEQSAAVKERYVQNLVYLRGLIEISNYCSKDCFYCGIRKSNQKVRRYNLSDVEILSAAKLALDKKYGSIVIQSGELSSRKNTERIRILLEKIREMSEGRLRVTLSCGEQSYQTYKTWLEAGAARYLLRIETSNPDLYIKLHPQNKKHAFDIRLECLERLRDTGYQLGTGVMIGLPFQTLEDMAADLLWMNQFNIDMVGMGPYLEHKDTPLYQYRNELLPRDQRFDLSLKMIAILRIMMKNINIAASTAMQSIEKLGREKAIKVGANVFMPNITPGIYRDNYRLYDDKPCTDENAEDCGQCVEVRMALTGHQIAWDSWGDSAHYQSNI